MSITNPSPALNQRCISRVLERFYHTVFDVFISASLYGVLKLVVVLSGNIFENVDGVEDFIFGLLGRVGPGLLCLIQNSISLHFFP